MQNYTEWYKVEAGADVFLAQTVDSVMWSELHRLKPPLGLVSSEANLFQPALETNCEFLNRLSKHWPIKIQMREPVVLVWLETK